MTILFRDLEQIDRELWLELGKPKTSSMFDPAGYMRANQALFRENEVLANHAALAEKYKLARKWFLRFQYGGLLGVITFMAALVRSNAL